MNILITGGSGGLGKQIVTDLLKLGHDVYYTYNQRKVMINNENAKSIKVDFRDQNELVIFLNTIEQLNIDVLINNYFNKITKNHAHKLNRDLLLAGIIGNVIPTIEITNQVVKNMRKQRKGLIINILTDYLKSKTPTGISQYASEKAYLEKFMQSIETENFNFNIRIRNIYPKIMFTDFVEIDSFQKDVIIGSGNFSTVTDISNKVINAISKF